MYRIRACCSFRESSDQFIHQNKGMDHARNGNDDGFRKILIVENTPPFQPWVGSVLPGFATSATPVVDGVENTGVLVR